MEEIVYVDQKLLEKYNRSIPRYTSYPTAPQFYPIEPSVYMEKLCSIKDSVSLYLHIPFCRSMCLFCGCSVVLNRSVERQQKYLEALLLEIDLVSCKQKVSQIHFGGGTPTSLSESQFEALFNKIYERFEVLQNAEISIEIDPRTITEAKLLLLKNLGVNRVSFGVQDLDWKVQEAVKRRQSEKMTIDTYMLARKIGFRGINIDLIYGLPFQTPESFLITAAKLTQLKPDRMAFYSYAKVPWLKPHQKAIKEETLPSMEQKFQIYIDARAQFMQNGYTAIGMDHFALSHDPMAIAYREKKLMRNFQGYSIELAQDMIGLGVTSIGFVKNCYFQNAKNIDDYLTAISQRKLPIERGYLLNEEDNQRRKAIQSWMCHFEIFKQDSDQLCDLNEMIQEGLVEEKEDKFVATALGKLFIRIIASCYDANLHKGQFSKVV